MADIKIKGGPELAKFLQQLPEKLQNNVMRGAMRVGAKPIMEQAKANAPVGQPSSDGRKKYKLYAGALRDSVRIRSENRRGFVKANVVVGGKSKKTGANVFYAHIVEFTGAKQHRIAAVEGKSLFFGGAFRKEVTHPGMQARPFLRPALDQQASNAIRATGEYVKRRLATKHGLDTADVIFEVQE